MDSIRFLLVCVILLQIGAIIGVAIMCLCAAARIQDDSWDEGWMEQCRARKNDELQKSQHRESRDTD